MFHHGLVLWVILLTKFPVAIAEVTPDPELELLRLNFYYNCTRPDATGQLAPCVGAKRQEGTYRSSQEDSRVCMLFHNGNCDYAARFQCRHDENLVLFELLAVRKSAEDSGYVAGAMSTDRKMGDDVAVACVWNSTGVHATLSYNSGRSNAPIKDLSGLMPRGMYISDKLVYCELLLNYTKIEIRPNHDFQYEYVHNILVVGGPIKGDKLLHHDARMSTAAISFHTSYEDIALAPNYSVEQFHASYMIFTWMTLIPVGTFISRFYKETWARTYFVKRRIWHAFHWGCMILGLLMAWCSYLLISYDRLQFLPPYGTTEQWHGIVGGVTLILFLLQCTLSWRRPQSPIWQIILPKLHCLFGHIVYALGMVNIWFSPKWTYNVAPNSLSRRTITWLCIHAAMYLIMTLYVDWTDCHLQTGGYRAYFSYPMSFASDEEAPRPILRKWILFTFIIVSVVVSSITIQAIRYEEVELKTDFGFATPS